MIRSSQPEVRNPLLALPAAQQLQDMMATNPALKSTWKQLCRELKAQAKGQETRCYRQRKGPLTAYWMAVGTYAGHLANVAGRGK